MSDVPRKEAKPPRAQTMVGPMGDEDGNVGVDPTAVDVEPVRAKRRKGFSQPSVRPATDDAPASRPPTSLGREGHSAPARQPTLIASSRPPPAKAMAPASVRPASPSQRPPLVPGRRQISTADETLMGIEPVSEEMTLRTSDAPVTSSGPPPSTNADLAPAIPPPAPIPSEARVDDAQTLVRPPKPASKSVAGPPAQGASLDKAKPPEIPPLSDAPPPLSSPPAMASAPPPAHSRPPDAARHRSKAPSAPPRTSRPPGLVEVRVKSGPSGGVIAAVALSWLATAAIAFVLGRSTVEPTPVAAVPSATAMPSPSASAAPAASNRAAPATPAGLIDRVRRGDPDALDAMGDRAPAKRTSEEALALSTGQRAAKLTEIATLGERLRASAELLQDGEVQMQVRKLAYDPDVFREMLMVLATLDGSGGADTLYAIWTATAAKTDATRLAEALVRSKDVRAKAAPGLKIALDLWDDRTCEDFRELLPTALEHADQRSLRQLHKLKATRGCGEQGAQDCYPCLREDKRLDEVLATASRRAPPR